MAKAGAALLALVLVAVGAAGCGEEEGVAAGAVVTVYVEAGLCAGFGGQDGVDGKREQVADQDFEVRYVCLPDPRGPQLSQGVGGRRVDLATVGANARRASEDSSAVAFLQLGDPAVNRFSEPILEMAGIGWLTSNQRVAAFIRTQKVLSEADPGDLRADVREALGQG